MTTVAKALDANENSVGPYLSELAKEGKIDPVIGRDAEVRQMVDILIRRRQNNPILTGEAGVGKTAVVEGFALRIASGDVPPPFAPPSKATQPAPSATTQVRFKAKVAVPAAAATRKPRRDRG